MPTEPFGAARDADRADRADQYRVHGDGWGIRVGLNQTRPGHPLVIEIVLAGDDPAAQAFRFALSRFLRGILAAWQTWLTARAGAAPARTPAARAGTGAGASETNRPK